MEQSLCCVGSNCETRIKTILPFYQGKQNTMAENTASFTQLYNEYFQLNWQKAKGNFRQIIPLDKKFSRKDNVGTAYVNAL